MRAWVLHDIGDFRPEDRPVPAIGEHQVLVSVEAAGICGSDIPRVYETGAHVHPLVPGHEFSGRVVETGKGVDVSWKHKRVGVFPLIPCGACEPCSKRQYEMCRNYSYLGSRTDGGFAEYVAVPEWNLIELPERVSYAGAAMLEPMAVAVHAMRRGFRAYGESEVYLSKPSCGDSRAAVAVCGLGTIGLLLVMFLRQAGVKNLLVIGNKDFQREQAERLGVPSDNYCDCRTEQAVEWLMQKTSGKGVDLFYECVGKNQTVTWAVETAAPAGAVVLVGNPYTDMCLDKAVYWKVLRNQLKLTGTWNSSFTHDDGDDWHYALHCMEQGAVKPELLISHRLCLQRLDEGFRIMRDKTEDYVKVMWDRCMEDR